MKRLLSAVLLTSFFFLAVFLVLRFLIPWLKPENGYLQVNSTLPVTVYLDSKEIGTSPYRAEKLKIGDYRLDLKGKIASSSSKVASGRELAWTTQISLASNTLSVVNVDFGPSNIFTAVEVLSLQKGSTSISIAAEPSNVKVELDDQSLGETPLNKEIKAGVHRLKLSKEGFIPRVLDVNIQEGYKTVVKVTLATNPLTKVGSKLATQASASLYDLSSSMAHLSEKPDRWAEGVFFFQEKGSTSETKFDCLIDYNGKVYYYDKKDFEAKLKAKKAVNLGYLGNSSEGKLSSSAQKSWEGIFPAAKIAQVQIQPTPTGTLNVRQTPSQSGKILTTVKPGEKYELLGEQSGWFKIKVGSIQGWVSTQYSKKI